jgi:hypothetical protein
VAVAERLGEGLGAFQLARLGAWPKARDAGRGQGVSQPRFHRRLRADHHQVGGDLAGQRDQSGYVRRRDLP